MAYSPDIYTYNGLDLPYNITFTFPGKFSTVRVKYSEPLIDTFITLVEGVDYELVFAGGIPQKVLFLLDQTNGGIVRIERVTPRNVLVNYDSGENISADDHDNEAKRGAAVDEEIEAQAGDFLPRDPSGTNWTAEGEVIKNSGFAVDSLDVPNFGQMLAAISGQDILEIDSAVVIDLADEAPSDGVRTKWSLTGIQNVTKRGVLIVTLDNILQNPIDGTPRYNLFNPGDGGYTGIDPLTEIEFTIPPVTGTVAIVRTLTGTVKATAADLSVGTNQIENNAVTLAKLAHAGAANEVWIMEEDGTDPENALLNPKRISGVYVAGTAAAGFKAAVLEAKLDDFAALTPGTDPVNFSGNKLLGLTAGAAASTDGCNVIQMESHVATQLSLITAAKISAGELTDWTVRGSSQTKIIADPGFKPLCLKMSYGNGLRPTDIHTVDFVFQNSDDGTFVSTFAYYAAGSSSNAFARWEIKRTGNEIAIFSEAGQNTGDDLDFVNVRFVVIG